MSTCASGAGKSRIDKLGLKAGHRYQAWGEFDEEFGPECTERAGEPGVAPLDVIFVRLHSQDDLPSMDRARAEIQKAGMIWCVWIKGRKELNENHVRDYALAHSLVDVKVCSFSPTLSALKMVIPVKDR